MVVKGVYNRDKQKHSQTLEPSLPANHQKDFHNMAATSGQDGTSDASTNGRSINESVLHAHKLTGVTFSSLHFHIRVLYAIVICLTVVIVSTLVICYLEITSLREELSRQLTLGDLVDFKFPSGRVLNDDLQMPYISPEDELSLGEFWDGGEFVEDKTRFKRRASFHEGSGTADDWLWMSSFARVPRSKEGMIIALQSYCREAQLYCAASGKPGSPGLTGPKGEMGEKGEKGDFADESAIAISLANIEAVRGPPGPQGERGPEGPLGPIGPKGEMGAPGIPGENGSNGYSGPRGPKGEPGTRGLLGFPGMKGDPGPAGEPGPKGDVGPPGRDGNPGFDGAKGERGVQGPPGERGISGLPGVPGLKGLHGEIGLPGIDGMPGQPGLKGERGYCHVGCDDTDKSRPFTEATTPAPTFPPRVRECSIEIVGVPVFQRDSQSRQGAWMKDSKRTQFSKIWVTYGVEGNSIIEYSSYDNFKNNREGKEILLSGSGYFGTGHVVYDGHLYYHWSGSPKIVRFDLTAGQTTTVRTIPDMVHSSTKSLKWQGFLYQSQTMFVHFNVDQNGLWMIYGSEKSANITVALLNTENLDIINSVNVNLELGSKGGAFIACGKLYTLKHHNRQRSFLDEEHDLWLNEMRRLRINFNNPYTETYMLAYDHNSNQIHSWDGGRLLSLPLLLKSN